MTSIFHEGELAVQRLAGEEAIAERNSSAIARRIMSGALPFLEKQAMAVIAYADRERQVWASILFGRPGFVRSSDGLTVDIHLDAVAIQPHDPIWASIGGSKPAGMLLIELGSRRRIRMNGDLRQVNEHLLQLAVRESFPNCPKYITRRSVRTVTTEPVGAQLFLEGKALGAEQMATVADADAFFVATVHPDRGFDASHRGGAAGFVELVDEQTLRVPDYPGNSMFNTLGNLVTDARAGLVIPDFARGRVLRLTGRAATLWKHPDDSNASGGTHRFLQFHVEQWNQELIPPGVQSEFLDYSPFNPR